MYPPPHRTRGVTWRRVAAVVAGAAAAVAVAAAPASAATSATLTRGVLTVSGDSADNTITISTDADGEILINGGEIKVRGVPQPRLDNTRRIEVLGRSGDDTITIDDSNAPMPPATLIGGPGDDTLVGSGADDTLIGEVGNDTMFGGGGDDIMSGGNGDDFADGDRGADNAQLGAGNDVFRWDPGDGSDLVNGQGGDDTMEFNGSGGSEIFEASANGSRLRFTRDLGNIVMDVHAVETVDLNALAGADRLTVDDLGATDVERVDTDLAPTLGGTTGDGETDVVVVNGTDGDDVIDIVPGTDPASVSVLGLAAQVDVRNLDADLDSLIVNSLGGDDVVTATALPAAIVDLAIDGGAGADDLFGSQGDDTLHGGDGDDFAFGDNGADTAFLGAGDDEFQWDPGDGSDIVEGEDGTDQLTFLGGNGTDEVSISEEVGRTVFFRNPGNITMELAGVEVIDFQAFGGADEILVDDLADSDTTEVRTHLGGDDDAADRIVHFGVQGDDPVVVAGDANQVVATGLAPRLAITGAEADLDSLVFVRVVSDEVDVDGLAAGSIQLAFADS